uniref:Uncharacterized protein n=1 Tax=Arundo donax TaxID=35708 RepID=A0A0A9FDW8_ARUDO
MHRILGILFFSFFFLRYWVQFEFLLYFAVFYVTGYICFTISVSRV